MSNTPNCNCGFFNEHPTVGSKRLLAVSPGRREKMGLGGGGGHGGGGGVGQAQGGGGEDKTKRHFEEPGSALFSQLQLSDPQSHCKTQGERLRGLA